MPLSLDGTTGISASGNVTAAYILGNGSQLSGVITSVSNINNGTSNVNIGSSGANVTVGVAGTANVAVFTTTGMTMTGNILPTANITYDLGTSSQRWKDIWLANSTIYLGAANISASGTAVVLPANSTVGGEVVASGPITESAQAITANKTITAGYNGQSVGPVTVQSGVAVTVGTDQRWIIWG